MASWDYPAVAAPRTADYAPPIANFSGLGNLVEDYYKGKDLSRAQDKADAFRNGIPRVDPGNPNSDPDFNKISDTAAKVGGIDYALPLLNLQVQRDAGAGNAAAVSQAQGVANGQKPSPVTPQPSAPLKYKVGSDSTEPPAAPAAAAQPTVMTILAAQGIPNDQLQAAAASVARQLGVSPTDPIDTSDPQVRNVLGPAIQQLKGVGQIAQSSQPAPNGGQPSSPSPQTAPSAQPQPAQPQATPVERVAQGADATPVASGDMATADRLDLAAAGLRQRAAATANLNPKGSEGLLKQADAYSDRAKQIREQVGTAAQPTNNMKEYRQAVAQGYKGSADEWAAQAEGDKATSQERAKADVKEQQSYIDAGKQAGSRLATLNTIGNIVNTDKNLTLGFGADTALKVKMALQQLGVPIGGDLSGAEGIQKMNAALASEMAKSLSGRPTQFEFKSFMANNPGLLLDKSGNQRLIGIYSQLAKREYDLGKMARQNGDNWSKWDDMVEGYDAKHPIVDPISKQPISTNSVIAPGPDKPVHDTTTQATGALKDGATAINPKTGERLMLQGGKWMPFT